MSLLTICQGLALNVGMASPTVVATSPDRQWAEGKQFANEAGLELNRRVDWGHQFAETTLTGDGTNKVFSLPSAFARVSAGIPVLSGTAIVRPLSRQEWNGLVPVVGTPRYFLLQGNTMTLWPYLANAATVLVKYQSNAWCSAGTAFVADGDTSFIDEDLLLKCLIVRWRRQKGMDFADQEAEYEAELATVAKFDDRSRLA